MEASTILEQLFFNTVMIKTFTNTGESGSGTGFFFGHMIDGKQFPFIVTNKHVVEGTHSGQIYFNKRVDDKPVLDGGFSMTMTDGGWSDAWIGHPDPDVDITVCALGPILHEAKAQLGFEPFFSAVAASSIPSDHQLQELNPTEEVVFVGYPNGIWDSANLLPVMRRGSAASPLQVDFENTPRFLIDASVFGGSSGSPVYIVNTGFYGTKDGSLVAGSRFYFLGVVAAVFFRTQLNDIISIPIPTSQKPMARQSEMIDLGIVFKARTVVEAIEHYTKARILPVAN